VTTGRAGCQDRDLAKSQTRAIMKDMSTEYISPLALSAEQRKSNLMDLNARMARATDKVAADKTQSRKVRSAAQRDNAAAKRIAKVLS
jgi:hypothetical protein